MHIPLKSPECCSASTKSLKVYSKAFENYTPKARAPSERAAITVIVRRRRRPAVTTITNRQTEVRPEAEGVPKRSTTKTMPPSERKMKCNKSEMVMPTMWKIFMVMFVMLPTATLARMHSSAAAALHGGLGLGLGGVSSNGGVGNGGSLSTKDAHVKTKDVDAVEGKSVSLPCPISAPLDDVYMVLWFRDNAGIPLYSFDMRNKMNSDQPRHWSAPEVFGSRAKFHFDSEPATLEIKDIKRHDQGIYRCRIDFRTSQTQSFRFNLSVIILPEQPIILDRWGRQLNGSLLGPKQEGDDIVITCRVVGGRPQPQVRWLVNGLLVDNQYEHNSGDVIENRLLWPSVQRTDLNSVFTCQALNTQLDKPKEKSFLLDMHLKPLTVKIIDPPGSMVAERRYEVVCESTGSRPNAIITWYKGKRQLRRTKDDIWKNTTRSELSFVPTTDDDGKSITCRAENPNVNGLYLETMWKLNVVYPPLVTLRLGSTLTPEDIKEGDDVYFECHVQSNPQWRKLLWLHNGIHLEHNTSARVIRSNQSLVLQKITKHYAGNYACSAINDEGETVSNQLPLRVKYTPVCKHLDRVILIGASKDETVEVACEIQADPPPRTFRWKFNNSGETLDVGSERFSVNGSRSVLKYTPVNDQDYGTLSCWASNEVGTQQQPCLYQVVLAALPNAVGNCSVFNRTELSVDIQCIPGYDGGLPQIFVLEMFSTRTGITRVNITNPEEPQFSVENLDTLTSVMTQENNSMKLRIYSFNQKGRSPSYVLHDFIIGSTAYRTDEDVSLALSPVIVGSVLTIVIISLAIAVRIFMVTFVNNLRRNRQHGTKATAAGVATQAGDVFKGVNLEKPRWQHTDIKTKSSEDLVEDERDPDVIPSQYVGSGGSVSGIGSSGSGGSAGSSGGSSVGVSGASTTATDHRFPAVTGGSVTGPSASAITTKWSPNSNHPAGAYDTILQQPGESNAPITYNQINARAHLMTSPSSMLSPTAVAKQAAGALHHSVIGSPTGSSTMTSILGGGTLPPGLGSGSGYILNSLINSNGAPSCSGSATLHHLPGGHHNQLAAATGVGGTMGRHHVAGQMHHPQMPPPMQQQQYHHNTLGSSGRHHHHHAGAGGGGAATTSTSALSVTGSTSMGVGLLMGGGGSSMGSSSTGVGGMALTSATSTTTTSCNSSTDLDDNININAIKDCLMTQRVPESCV